MFYVLGFGFQVLLDWGEDKTSLLSVYKHLRGWI